MKLPSIFLLLCLYSWTLPSAIGQTSSNDSLSLNGSWKFHTIYGQGSDYLRIDEQEGDIILDNSSEKVEVKGNWTVSSVGDRESGFYGKDYLKTYITSSDESQRVVFSPDLPQSGDYEVFVRFPFGIHLSAKVSLHHDGGIDDQYFSQRALCDEWLSMGIFQLSPEGVSLTVSADSPGQVTADAVMFRPVDSAKLQEAKKELQMAYSPSLDDQSWNDLKVPGHWGMLNEYSNYTGKGWYRKSFRLPSSWKSLKGHKALLKFEGVYHVAKVYLNGEYIGQHRGGFTPFEFEVSDELLAKGENLLAVEADNNPLVGATWNWGGIIREVYLVRSPEVRILRHQVQASPDLDQHTASIRWMVELENASSVPKDLKLVSSIWNEQSRVQGHAELTLAPSDSQQVFLELTLNADQLKLWHFDEPNLYTIESKLMAAGKEISTITERFGIRKISLTDSSLLLNGEPVRLAGLNRVSDHRYYGSSEPADFLREDLLKMKELGVNFTRIMHGTQNRKLLELCDELGIMVIEEVNVRDLENYEFTAPEYPLVRQWLKEMIQRDINHPSIVGWSVGNELADHYDYARDMMAYVKSSLDSSRLVSCVSNTGWREDATRETDPNTFVDIILHNHYPFQGELDGVLKRIRSVWPEKPVFISEFGLDRLATASRDEDIPELDAYIQQIRKQNTFVIGASQWTYNDYRSTYIGTDQEENRTWGAVNAWRQKRPLYQRIQRLNSPVNDIRIKGQPGEASPLKLEIPIKSPDDYPAYAMRNYSLELNYYGPSGNIIHQEIQELPDLHPGDADWQGSAEAVEGGQTPIRLVANLRSPMGIIRYQKILDYSAPSAPVISSIIPGNGQLRVLFEKQFGASQHYIHYKVNGKSMKSAPSYDTYIDLKDLENGQSYDLKLIAVNGQGESPASALMAASPDGKPLPPVLWKGMIADGKLIIGYSGEVNDESYTLRYGNSPDQLDQEITEITRGMMVVDLPNQRGLYYQLRRKVAGQESHWSALQQIDPRGEGK
ncbi:glycoside hydrolase family 2 [Echinicola pacifica]|uniref:glycoside hydrolase family 2 n=1 Tax=Echinicola pacifica TaxID=346377 RepID=UPI00039E0B5F|nr:glycoside hydrolase family 2 [Echinicola pacifica]